MTDHTHQKANLQGDKSQEFRLAVMVSGTGSNLQALIDAIERRELPGVKIALVISNKVDAYGLKRALDHALPTAYIPWTKQAQQQEAEMHILGLLQLFRVDLIVLAGWMRIFSPDFSTHLASRMINLHPSLLPDHGEDTYTTSNGTLIPALRGLHVVPRALAAHLPVTGSTVHYVVPEVDAGPVICRGEVAILPDDTQESLHERIKSLEHYLVVEAVRNIAHST